MPGDSLTPLDEARLTASTRKLVFFFFLIVGFSFASVWFFMEWSSSHFLANRRFIPVRAPSAAPLACTHDSSMSLHCGFFYTSKARCLYCSAPSHDLFRSKV